MSTPHWIQKLRELKTQVSPAYRRDLWMLMKQAKYGNYDPAKDDGIDFSQYPADDADIKRDGWSKHKGMCCDSAETEYVALANKF
ncbi:MULTISPECIES: acyl-CoA-binding protein [unclassified Pseudomonas]|nr:MULTISPECIES: acyl-CoA-binding protein [unclassified Pseudomonas]